MASRKREAEFDTASGKKKAKVTNADALLNLTASIGTFGDKVCSALAIDPTLRTPHRRSKALTQAQKETWLELGDRMVLFSILEQDIRAVDAYLAVEGGEKEFREMYINKKVAEAKRLGSV